MAPSPKSESTEASRGIHGGLPAQDVQVRIIPKMVLNGCTLKFPFRFLRSWSQELRNSDCIEDISDINQKMVLRGVKKSDRINRHDINHFVEEC